MSVICILETDPGGHHMWYLSVLVESIQAAEPETQIHLLVSHKVRTSDEFGVLASELNGTTTTQVGCELDSEEPVKLAHLAISEAALVQSDRLIILDCDRALSALFRRRKNEEAQISIQIMRPPEYPALSIAGGRVFLKFLLITVLVIAGRVDRVALLASPMWKLQGLSSLLLRHRSIVPLIDPVRRPGEISLQKGHLNRPSRLLVPGVLSHRKLVSELLAAIETLSPSQLPVIRMIGSADSATASMAQSLGDKLTFDPRFLSESELDSEIQWSDIVWCVNTLDVPSGFSARAVLRSRAIVASRSTRVGQFVSRTSCGYSIEPSTKGIRDFLLAVATGQSEQLGTGADELDSRCLCGPCFAAALNQSRRGDVECKLHAYLGGCS